MSTTEEPLVASLRPTWLHYLTAFTGLGLGLWIVGEYASLYFFEDDPLALIGLIMYGPVAVLLAWYQYRGTFRQVPRAALFAGRTLYGLAGFLAFGLIANVGEAVMKGENLFDPSSGIEVFAVMAAIAAVLALGGRSNQLWSRRLEAAYGPNELRRPHHPVTMQQFLGGLGLATLVLGVVAYHTYERGPRYGEHLPSTAIPFFVPAVATDVCYARLAPYSLKYEFAIDEAGFRDFADHHFESATSEERRLAEIKDVLPGGECQIDRYVSLMGEAAVGEHRVDVHDGLCFESHRSHSRRQAVYDRKSGRAYFSIYRR